MYVGTYLKTFIVKAKVIFFLPVFYFYPFPSFLPCLPIPYFNISFVFIIIFAFVCIVFSVIVVILVFVIYYDDVVW